MFMTIIGPMYALIIVLLSAMSCNATGPVTNPSESSGAFATGRYRNLFVEAGYSPQEVTAKIHKPFIFRPGKTPTGHLNISVTSTTTTYVPRACHTA
jgi:hypothetical protein